MARLPKCDAEALVCPGGFADVLTGWISIVGFSALIVIALVTMVDVFLRFLFGAPIEGLEDINRYTFAVAIATCLPAGLLQGHNITIRFLGGALGWRAALWLEALGAVATFAFLVLLVWRFAVFSHDEAEHGRFTLTLGMPTAPWWFGVTGLLAVCAAVQFCMLVTRVARARSGRIVAEHAAADLSFSGGASRPDGDGS